MRTTSIVEKSIIVDPAQMWCGVDEVLVQLWPELGGEAGLDLVREVIAHPHDEVVAIGLDSNEVAARPSEFIAAYDLAREAGLKLTAHAGERRSV
jgi:adenosine deaminase